MKGLKKILIIEDDVNILKYVKSILEDKYKIYWEDDGINGLKRFYSLNPDLLILDIMLPELSGFQICRIIKSDDDFSNIPIIAMTASTKFNNKLRIEDSGVDDYIQKPFLKDELISLIEKNISFERNDKKKSPQQVDDILKRAVKLLDDKIYELSILNELSIMISGENVLNDVLIAILRAFYKLSGITKVSIYFKLDNIFRYGGEMKNGIFSVFQPSDDFPKVISLENIEITKGFFKFKEDLSGLLIARNKQILGFLLFKQMDKKIISYNISNVFREFCSLAIWNCFQYEEIMDKAQTLEEANKKLKEMQLELISREKLSAMGQLACTMAHEINNPLAGISGYAQLIGDSIDNDKNRKFCKKIVEESERISKSIEKFLHFSDKPFFKEKVNVLFAMNEAISLLKGNKEFRTVNVDIGNKNIDFFTEIDRNELIQVFMNILLNSAQAMKGRGKINIKFKRIDNFIEIMIKDNGPGIDKEIRGKIFTPMFSFKKDKGSGLGLPLCMSILQKYGGHLYLDTSNKNGTCFKILIKNVGREK